MASKKRSSRPRSRRGGPQPGRPKRHRYGDSIEEVRVHVRDALAKIGPSRHFTMRELRAHVLPETSSADVQRTVQALVRGGYLALDARGYRLTSLGWTWIEGAERRTE